MIALLLTPAVVSALALAAHFLRAGRTLIVLLVLATIPLLLVPRAWARRIAEITLLLGAAEWVRTLVLLARYRMAVSEPWLRMAVILGAVAGLALLSVALLEHRRVSARTGAR